MSCRQLEKWVWSQGSGNLPAGFLDHAARCEECRRLIEEVRLLDRSVGTLAVPDPGEHYWEGLAHRISEQLDRPIPVIHLVPYVPRWRRVLSHAWAPATAVAILALIATRQPVTLRPETGMDRPQIVINGARFTEKESPLGQESSSLVIQAPPGNLSREVLTATAPPSQALRKDEAPAEAEADSRSSSARVPDRTYIQPVFPPGPTLSARESGQRPNENVWPERQVTIMGEVDSNAPSQVVKDDRRLATQDQYATYERQVVGAQQGLESAGTFATPGRLMGGPGTPTVGRGAEQLTPVERMRNFDEISELRELIARLEAVPPSQRSQSQWTQWSTAWFRLGHLTDQRAVLDSALSAVDQYMLTALTDSTQLQDWKNRRIQLQGRRSSLRP